MDWENVIADRTCLVPCHYTAGRSGSIQGITIHHMAGNLTIDGCYSVWTNREASAHYAVEADGTIGQLVNDCDTAWACGDWWANSNTISIEHANDGSDPWTVWPAAVDAGAHLVAALCRYYNLGEPEWMVNVFPHNHWQATGCPGELAGSQNAEYMRRAKAYYHDLGGCVPAQNAQESHVRPSGGSDGYHIHLQAQNADSGILPAVTDNEDNAGDGSPMLWLSAWTDAGTLDVQAQTESSGWLPKLSNPDDINDGEDGCVGDGSPIRALRMYYWSPNGDKAVYYRACTEASGWLPWMKDDTDLGGSSDDFAGDGSRITNVEAYIGEA